MPVEQPARRAAEALVDRGVEVIVASPMRRTRQTAEIAAAALGLEIEWDEGFVEAAFGAWEGLTFAQVMERAHDDLQAWRSSTAVAPPGGEALPAVITGVYEDNDLAILETSGTALTLTPKQVRRTSPINCASCECVREQ